MRSIFGEESASSQDRQKLCTGSGDFDGPEASTDLELPRLDAANAVDPAGATRGLVRLDPVPGTLADRRSATEFTDSRPISRSNCETDCF